MSEELTIVKDGALWAVGIVLGLLVVTAILRAVGGQSSLTIGG